MDFTSILDASGNAIYAALGLSALYGVFCVVMLIRRIAQKRFATAGAADQFFTDVRGHLERRDYEGLADLCDSPPYWSKAAPQLILIALVHRRRGAAKLRRMLAESFERDVLADLEYRTSYISTIVKTAPMLGLLGTVVGMISAFGKIAQMQQTGSDPSQLAGDISFALFTTALGLAVAIPLVLAGAMIHVRIGKLQDSVQMQISEFLDDLEATSGDKGQA